MRQSKAFFQNSARRPGRRRADQPQAAAACRLHPPLAAGIYSLPAAGAAQHGQDRGHHPRGDERHRRAGDHHAGGASGRPVEGNRPLVRGRPGDGPLAGPRRPRHDAGHDPRGGGGRPGARARSAPIASCRSWSTTSRPSAATSPRPRGGLIRVREFTMKDSYTLDVDEAGLDRQYEAHRRPITASSSAAALR